MPEVLANGQQLYYEELGAGDPVLFIHGFGSDLNAWGLVTRELRESYRCIVYDQRDSGRSGRAAASYTVRDMAADAAALIAACDAAPCHVVGYSMGGAVAQELAINYPASVRSLTLVATYDQGDQRGTDNLRSWAHMRETFTREEYFRAIYPWLHTYREYEQPGFIDERIRRSLEAPNPQDQAAFVRQMEATLGHDAASRLPSITAPTQVIVGAEDILAPLRFGRALAAAIPRSRLLVLPDVGHSLLSVKPDDVKRAILGFLGSVEDDERS